MQKPATTTWRRDPSRRQVAQASADAAICDGRIGCLQPAAGIPDGLFAEPPVGNYFVAVYPPFSRWEASQISAVEEALHQPAPASPMGLYVHIPFCEKKCDYCYYLSYVGQSAEVVDHYLDSVVRELALYSERPAAQGRRVSFVYFGGGTPSTLTPSQVRRLASGLRDAIDWDGVEEFTCECAPHSARRELLQALRAVGVTRLSMGVQSFDNELLKLNGRIHLVEDVLRACTLIQEVGFDWVNLDLMTGLMGETDEQWRDSVRRVIELSPDSVTVYQTEIPYNTRLYRDLTYDRLRAALVPWDVKRARLNYAFGQLEQAGYTVVSGYAAVKDPSRHRFLYQHYLWRGGDMLGLGVAAFSYFGGVHFQNQVALSEYESSVRHGTLPLKRAYRLTERERLVREFILQLKWGAVEAEPFRRKFDADITEVFAQPLQTLTTAGLLSFSNSGVRLTRDGLLRVDRLLPFFYDPQYQGVRYT